MRWLSIFGIVSGSVSVVSAISRLFEIGILGFISDIVEFYRSFFYPITNIISQFFGVSLSPFQSDLMALYLVFSLVFFRILFKLTGFIGYLKCLNPFSFDAEIQRMAIAHSLGFSRSNIEGKKSFRILGAIRDYFWLVFGITFLWPLAFIHLWRNPYCWSVMGRVIVTDTIKDPEMLDFLLFNFRKMFSFQIVGITITSIIFFFIQF